jgi:hypothetical protein
MKRFFKLTSHTQPKPQIPDFLAGVDLPQALPADSADILRLKASIILEAYFDSHGSLPRDKCTWLDVAQSLAQMLSSSDIVTQEGLRMLLDQLQNPGSEFYLRAFELLMSLS